MKQTISQRYWAKVQVRGANECWPWRAAKNKQGRGMLKIAGTNRSAPKVAWMLAHGKRSLPKLHVCHSCDNPNCVNPKHLWLGTQKQNLEDARSKGRVLRFQDRPDYRPWNAGHTHCARGHRFSKQNTALEKRGNRIHRHCKACHEAARKRRERSCQRDLLLHA
jgi:hypothetical protein